MPRLAPSLLRLAAHESPFLAPVLRECRHLPSARNELRWLREHALHRSHRVISRSGVPATTGALRPPRSRSGANPGCCWRTLLRGYVERRCRGEPLQYIIGSQPFGELDILCERGVLIPRCETELYTERVGCLVKEFLDESKKEDDDDKEAWGGVGLGPLKPLLGKERLLRVLDLCTGTGCIPLGIYEMLSRGRLGGGEQEKEKERESKVELEVLGVDISTTAVGLARRNLLHNIELGHLPRRAADDVRFMHADVLESSSSPRRDRSTTTTAASYILDALQIPGKDRLLKIDILTANPPYISPVQFSPSSGHTARSVRKFEPALALVPASTIEPPPGWPSDITPTTTAGDEFYYHILLLADHLDAGLTVVEVGDTAQADRVLELARKAAALPRGEEERSESVLEIWFDDGKTEACAGQDTNRLEVDGKSTTMNYEPGKVSGQSDSDQTEVSARAVVIWRREWAEWRRGQVMDESRNPTQRSGESLSNLSDSTGEEGIKDDHSGCRSAALNPL
jgi:methylase of polypeptide subunit release factors